MSEITTGDAMQIAIATIVIIGGIVFFANECIKSHRQRNHKP